MPQLWTPEAEFALKPQKGKNPKRVALPKPKYGVQHEFPALILRDGCVAAEPETMSSHVIVQRSDAYTPPQLDFTDERVPNIHPGMVPTSV